MSKTTLRNVLFLPFNHLMHRHPQFQAWMDLDRIEDFASNLGTDFMRRMDAGLIAFGSALCALAALVFVIWY